ncbi:hypothetical protein DB345_21165 [Spartobacteria bacterium LR76]|nr:hypothetical protein DB345_21165 [Spartobacteria bacterium LR76]
MTVSGIMDIAGDTAIAQEKTDGLHVRDLSVFAHGRKTALLENVSFSLPAGTFTAVIGLSGCGKSTLLRSLAGIQKPTLGNIALAGHSIEALKADYPLAISFLPQFASFHASLTVREILGYALALRLPAHLDDKVKRDWLKNLIALSGAESFLDQPYSTLSGGQMRRVAIAEELVGDPAFILLDELTTGLDIYSDGEIMAWLRKLANDLNKTIVLVTHQTEHLALCDQIAFLHDGRLRSVAPLKTLLAKEEVDSVEGLFHKYTLGSKPAPAFVSPRAESAREVRLIKSRPADGWQQFLTLLKRQCQLALRDKLTISVQLALTILFPVLVAIFALEGLPQLRTAGDSLDTNIVRALTDKFAVLKASAENASLISGLVMFQVILLALSGANNGCKEIAGEYQILRKERYAGLSTWSYVCSKFVYVTALSIVQAGWMTIFVKSVCGFPGSLVPQFAILLLVTLAMACTCLAISAAIPSPAKASLLSIYLVGFQLPLSGAALALPAWISTWTQPLISAYWGWSGFLRTLQGHGYFGLVRDFNKSAIADYSLSVAVLLAHIVIALGITAFFVKRSAQAQ